MSTAPTWRVARTVGPAGPFHAHQPDEHPEPSVWVHAVERPALVLGSTQPPDVVDEAAASAAGVEVVHRRSGGGAVLLEPGGSLWVDVVLPRDHARWSDDVGTAFHWLGAVWADALAGFGLPALVHRGPLRSGPWSDRVCFAGLGPGEVTVDGRKVVGISQRRTRSWARFQCAALTTWDPGALVALLAMDDDERRRATVDLAGVAAGCGWGPAQLEGAFLAAL